MKQFEWMTKPVQWLLASLLLALVVFVGGCGGGGGTTSANNGIANSTKAITAYSFAGYPASPGVINEQAKTIAVTVPSGTNLTALVATFSHTGTSMKVAAATQVSGTTANNFSAPLLYTVTAADATTVKYNVTVTVAAATAKAITAYSFAGYPANPGVINEPAKTIAVTVPSGTNLTALVATFTTTGTGVVFAAATQISGTTANNFTAPVVYTVTAADATTLNYSVTVTVAAATAKAITGYSFAGFQANPGVINEPAKTIAVTVPFGTNLTTLVATFTTTGTGVKVAAAAQTSGATANNFTAPVVYTVTATDTTTVNYSISVTVAAATAKAITAYSFAGFTNSNGVINELTNPKTIAVGVPPGTNVTALVAAYTSTGVSESVVATGIQTSGVTSNDFTSPVPYIVGASDLTTATYNVTITLGLGPVPILLGTSENFAILSKAGITDVPVPSSAITGNVGTSPITGASITGSGWCTPTVVGLVYSVDATGPACATINTTLLTIAIGDMGTAYTDAATRPAGAGGFLNPGVGILGVGTVLQPGLYTFNGASANVSIATNLTLTGGSNDVWIFQIPGTLGTSPAVQVTLAGGALAKNVFWQVAGAVTLGTTSHFEGVILAATNIAMSTGATINGRLLAQTFVTLGSNTITQPLP